MYNVFSKFNVKIVTDDIEPTGSVGLYDSKRDVIVIDTTVINEFPVMQKIIILHEMFHSTFVSNRTNRIERLLKVYGNESYKENSMAFKMEECIAEICTMVACKKLGLLNKYTSIVIEDGISKNYTNDMVIPWMEVVSAVKFFCEDDISFDKELDYVKCYLIAKYEMNIRRSYDNNSNVA
jgi:hypothetical protein